MNSIRPGAHVLVRSASGRLAACRALSGVLQGGDFPVVWVCAEEAWAEGLELGAPGDIPTAIPCPAEDVSVVEREPAGAGR